MMDTPSQTPNSIGGGLRPATGTGQPETTNANPESNLRLAGPIIVSQWPKNSRETLMVRLDAFRGQHVIDARSWYAGADGTLKPGRGGLTVSVKHLPQLAAALVKALETATASGLVDRGGAS